MKDDKDNVELTAVQDHGGILPFVETAKSETGMVYMISKACRQRMWVLQNYRQI